MDKMSHIELLLYTHRYYIIYVTIVTPVTFCVYKVEPCFGPKPKVIKVTCLISIYTTKRLISDAPSEDQQGQDGAILFSMAFARRDGVDSTSEYSPKMGEEPNSGLKTSGWTPSLLDTIIPSLQRQFS